MTYILKQTINQISEQTNRSTRSVSSFTSTVSHGPIRRIGHHLLPFTGLKEVFVQNLSYENKFDFHENEHVGGTHFHRNGFHEDSL